MQQTLLVTIKGRHSTQDVELPGDVSISDLLPLLHELCRPPADLAQEFALSPSVWSLRVEGLAEPLRPALTLFDNGVINGDVLHIREESNSPAAIHSPGRSGQSEAIQPTPLNGMIGVTWDKEWLS